MCNSVVRLFKRLLIDSGAFHKNVPNKEVVGDVDWNGNVVDWWNGTIKNQNKWNNKEPEVEPNDVEGKTGNNSRVPRLMISGGRDDESREIWAIEEFLDKLQNPGPEQRIFSHWFGGNTEEFQAAQK